MSLTRIFCALALASAALACGAATTSSTDTGDGGSDAGTTDARSDGATDAGSLVPPDATKVVVTEKGGMGPGLLDGSTCSPADLTFTLLLGTRDFSWNLCEYVDGGTYAFRAGQRVLSAAELATVTKALDGLRLNTETSCGADKPADQIVFTTPSGSVTYDDAFYSCGRNDGKIYVNGIDAVLAALGELAK